MVPSTAAGAMKYGALVTSTRRRAAVALGIVLVLILVVVGTVSIRHAQRARAADPHCTAFLGVGCTGLSLPAVEDAAKMSFPPGSTFAFANYTEDTRWRLRAMVQMPRDSLDNFLGGLDPAFYPNPPASGARMDQTVAELADFLTTNYGCTDVQGATSIAPGITRSYVVGKYTDGTWLVYVDDIQA
jgi:hypothetical protein